MIPEGPDLSALEKHLLGCPECVRRAKKTQVQAGIVRGSYDL
jgi:hypothetical protein